MTVHEKIRILISDDHRLLRNSLKLILQSNPDIEVVGEAENGEDAINQVKASCPDIVLMDVDMPVLDGVEATREVKKICKKIVVIGLSMHSDEHHIQQMYDAGATDFISKSANFSEIERSIYSVFKASKST